MKTLILSALAVSLFAAPALAQVPAPAQPPALPPVAEAAAPAAPAPAILPLSVQVKGFASGAPIPDLFAYCAPSGTGRTKNGGNLNPEISWADAPAATKSFAIIVIDRDVPAKIEDAGKEGITIPADAPRQDFYHWVLVDIPPALSKIGQGEDSRNWLAEGKQPGRTAYGVTGQNDYAKFMKGSFGGYDGPCPPWNDERLHQYHFTVYALDVPTLGLSGAFRGKDAEAMIAGHALAKGEVVGTYTNYVRR